MSLTEILAWSARCNLSTSSVRLSHTSLVEKMHTMLSFYHSFITDYGLTDGQQPKAADLLKTVKSYSVFSGTSENNCRRYIHMAEWFPRFNGALEHLIAISDTDSNKKLEAVHLDHDVYKNARSTKVFLLMDAVDAYVKNSKSC